MKSMHVVQLLPELNEGGVERGVVELNRELVKRGYRSAVICARGKLCPQIEADGGQVRLFDVCGKNLFTAPGRVCGLRKILRELSPDVLHVRSRVPGWLTRFANAPLRIPLVSTVHGYNSVSAYSKIMTAGDRVICVSDGIRQFIRQHYDTPEDRIRVIHRGVDLDAFPAVVDTPDALATIRAELGADGDQKLIVAVGRITELKGYEHLIHAAAELAKTRPDLAIAIVGGTREDKQAYAASLQALVAETGAPVRFVGSRSDVAHVYAAADVLVSCSRKPESFGRTLVEALAVGTPVVAADHGGATEILSLPELGQRFTPNDPHALATALNTQLDTPSSNPAHLRAHVENHFSLNHMVNQITAVYEEVCS